MEAVDRHYSREGATYRHHWLPGDVVIADNLHVGHKATPITPATRRILNRTTIRADGVIWYDGAEKLRTTCFRLSQKKLVGQIEFEVLKFDEVFKTSQIPIRKIEKATGLQFHDTIVDNDTSSGEDEPIE